MDVKWLFYALYVAVVQSMVVMWTTKPYIEYRSGKRYGKILLLLLLVFHDCFWSVFGGKRTDGLAVSGGCLFLSVCIFYDKGLL